MRKIVAILISGFALLVILELVHAQEIFYKTYLPVVIRPENTPTPTPTPTQPVAPRTGRVEITGIFYDGVVSAQEPDEYVVIQNKETFAVNLSSWTLRDNANHVYTFPTFTIQPGQACRIYTNQSHPEYCGFNYASASAIWNNDGDCAYLRNYLGEQISQRCY